MSFLVRSNSGLGRETDARSTPRGFVPEAGKIDNQTRTTARPTSTSMVERLEEITGLVRRRLIKETDAEDALRALVPDAERIIRSTYTTAGPKVAKIAKKLKKICRFRKIATKR